MTTRRMIAAIALATLVCAGPASAQTANVPFTGLILSTCTLTVGVPGILATNSDYTTFGSTQAGGLSGSIAVLATGSNFNVSADAPTSFSIAPAGANTSVNFSVLYRGDGATAFGNTNGTVATRINPGLTNVSVDLTAQKTSGLFPAGAYTAEVVVRCEQ